MLVDPDIQLTNIIVSGFLGSDKIQHLTAHLSQALMFQNPKRPICSPLQAETVARRLVLVLDEP